LIYSIIFNNNLNINLMGQEELQFNDDNPDEYYKRGKLTRNFFDFQYVIGKGGFGKVS